MCYIKEIITYGLLIVLFVACGNDKTDNLFAEDVIRKYTLVDDTLIVGTIAGPISYFSFREEYMGLDYELAQNLADSLQLKLKVIVAKNQTELVEMLAEKEIDIAAYNFQKTKELKREFNFVVPLKESNLVLVQPLKIKTIASTIDLKGAKITVAPNTVYEQRASQLNEELGNVFELVKAADSLTTENLIEQVASGKIEATVANAKLARLYKSHYKKLDIRLEVGFARPNGWLIRKESKELDAAIEKWHKSDDNEALIANLEYKYLRNSLYFERSKFRITRGSISPYDHLFKKYAPEIKWDWQLLAALAYHESRFDSAQVSRAGAAGLMQLMPRTAANFGLTRKNILNPERNIEAGVQYIKSLNLTFSGIENKQERIKFILASYNSGPAHILDARALALKYGKNKDVWFGHVEDFLIKKSDPQYYNDEVVKYGRFRANITVSYVQKTLNTYQKYKGKR